VEHIEDEKEKIDDQDQDQEQDYGKQQARYCTPQRSSLNKKRQGFATGRS